MKRRRCWIPLLGLLLAGCIGTDLVEELPTADARLDLTPAIAAVQEGDTIRFRATYYDAFGMERPQAALQWQSSDTSVAAVDAEGLVSALRAGQSAISARAEDAASPPALLTVVADPDAVARVVVSPVDLRLPPGATHTYTATALNLRGETVEGRTFVWRSSSPAVASIDADGTATALQAGLTDITATTEGVTSAPARLAVPGSSRRGTFVRRPGTSYSLEGDVALEEQPDGSLLLRLESTFKTSQGPGLHVYLSKTNAVTSTSLDLGALRKTVGADDYAVPASVEIDTFDWVIIHCLPFNVTFGYAELQ